jgi:predicted dithiol-disulfide oxidoreductase (DUF899 family)
VYHTYSAYARGLDSAIGTYALLELTAKGRNETTDMRDWLRHHDRYGDEPQQACCAHGNEGQGRA